MRTQAVIFDMDGTLTIPTLDFNAIRAEMGLSDGPILEALERLGAADRRRAEAVLEAHERRAAHESELQPGARAVLDQLRGAGIRTAILTRNARRWTDVVLDKHDLNVDLVRTRDDGVTKPSPTPVVELCGELGANPRSSWMVGDHQFDIQSGRNAGCRTVFMCGAGDAPPEAAEADHAIHALVELLDIIAAAC